MAHSDAPATLLDAVRQHVLHTWNDQHDARLTYHNYAQAAGVAERAVVLARAEGLPPEQVELVETAAWFHNIGYLYDPQQAAETSAIRAEFFLVEQKAPPEFIRPLRQTLLEALTETRPASEAGRVLRDAITVYDWLDDYDLRAPLLALETALLDGQTPDSADPAAFRERRWEACRKRQLLTATAKKKYETALARRLFDLQPSASRPEPETPVKKRNPEGPERFDRLARRPLRSSIQTYFRANYANHIRLSAIADNKAHIMISVNSILLSVAISLLTYQTLANRNPLYVLPIIMFLVTSLSSLIFAVLSSRPRVTHWAPQPDRLPNPVFFGNFVQLSLEQYEDAIDAMLRDGRLLFGNMTRDLYFLGLVLDKKYRLLTYSYTVFMMGFVATVGAFLGAYFLG